MKSASVQLHLAEGGVYLTCTVRGCTPKVFMAGLALHNLELFFSIHLESQNHIAKSILFQLI